MSSIYLGVYGIYINESKILMIKKARGPYKDMYDLPGGGIEFGETIEQALAREIQEETETTLIDKKFIGNNEYICEYQGRSGETKKSHHIGFYYHIDLQYDTIKTDPDGQDSLGAERISIDNLKNLQISPIAKPMIEKSLRM